MGEAGAAPAQGSSHPTTFLPLPYQFKPGQALKPVNLNVSPDLFLRNIGHPDLTSVQKQPFQTATESAQASMWGDSGLVGREGTR